MLAVSVALAGIVLLVESPAHAGGEPLQIMREAVLASLKNLNSGKGQGTYRRELRGKAADAFAFEIVFDGDKFNLILSDLVHPRTQEHPFDRRILISDGSVTFMRSIGDRVGQGAQTTLAYPPGPGGIRSAIQMPMEPVRATRGILDPQVFQNPSLVVVRLANGRLRANYDLNKSVGEMFEASPEAGYNVVLAEAFNKRGTRTGARFTAEWKRDGGAWYVAAWSREDWTAGEVRTRCELRYDRFAANPRVSPDLFTLKALELPAESHIIDLRPGPSKAYLVGDPQKLAEKKLDTMVGQMESLPVRGQTKQLQSGSRLRVWLCAINVIAILGIAGIWYLYWRRRKRIGSG
jgi:hypothetical protein